MKEKIIKILVSFFIMMLCCTLIARGAASMTVAKVKTEQIKRGGLTEEFSGDGTIKAQDKAFQSLPEGQKIARVLVNAGSKVEAGQGIIQLDLGFLEEKITEQQREIEKQRLLMEQQGLESRSDARLPATAQASLALDAAETALQDARRAYQEAADAYNDWLNHPPETSDKPVQQPEGQVPDGSGQTPEGNLGGSPDSDSDGSLDSAAWEQEKQALKGQMDAAAEGVRAAETAYNQAAGSYQLAQQEERNTKANEAKRAEAAQLAQQGNQVDLDKMQEQLQKLLDIQAAEGIITAGTAGTLQAAGAAEGAITTGSEQIIIETGGLEACGTMPVDKIGTVAAGDEIEVMIQGNTKAVTLTLERFEQDEEGKNVWYAPLKEGTYRLGTVFTYEYTKKSEKSYDTIIPLSALHESGGIKYVLTAEIRSGILGDSYVAVKTPVTVLETDDSHAALEAGLVKDMQIITESNKYVKEGDRVRLSE